MAGELILVIDDRELNLKLLRIVLERRGYRVTGAASAREARACVRAERPRLILMDVDLPDTDGLQLTREFKADPDLGGVPIVAVTARAMKGDQELSLAAGCDGYMSNPIEKNALLALVARCLSGG
jgi:two-component system, cell cycle response regulator DivK